MINQLILVGRLVKEVEIIENENGRKETKALLVVNRSYKNVEGIYDTDFIPIILWDGIAKKTSEYCRKGDILGVKGRIETDNDNIRIIAEKVTFLSSKKIEEDKEESEE